MKEFSQHLKAWRIERGLTQSQLADRSGIPRPNVAALESGRRECTLRTLARLASVLELSPGKLLDEWPSVTQGIAWDRHQIDRIAKSLLEDGEGLSNEQKQIREAVIWQAEPILRAAGFEKTAKRARRGRRVLPKDLETQILQKLSRILSSREVPR